MTAEFQELDNARITFNNLTLPQGAHALAMPSDLFSALSPSPSISLSDANVNSRNCNPTSVLTNTAIFSIGILNVLFSHSHIRQPPDALLDRYAGFDMHGSPPAASHTIAHCHHE